MHETEKSFHGKVVILPLPIWDFMASNGKVTLVKLLKHHLISHIVQIISNSDGWVSAVRYIAIYSQQNYLVRGSLIH